MKKNSLYTLLSIIVCFVLFSACPTESGGNKSGKDDSSEPDKTGNVTFINHTSYNAEIRRDYFNGPMLLELSAGQTKSVKIPVDNNDKASSTFSIVYFYQINDFYDTDSGSVIVSGIDPNVQLHVVIETGKSYTVQIPQPQNLEFQSAFLRILNISDLQFELRYAGTVFKQVGNDNLSVVSGKTGIYKLENIPSNGRLCQNYQIVSTFTNIPIPDFFAMNGFIFDFSYNGKSVIKTDEQTITFK